VLTDGTHVVELHHLKNFLHHDGMLVAYLPKEKVLLEADGYNPSAATATPPSPPSPYTASLLDNIERLKLDVQRIVPVHYPADNRVTTMEELRRWADVRRPRAEVRRQRGRACGDWPGPIDDRGRATRRPRPPRPRGLHGRHRASQVCCLGPPGR